MALQAIFSAVVLAALPPLLFFYRQTQRMASEYDPKSTDPALLDRNSQVKSYKTSRATYTGVRVFHRRHPHADKLPQDPAPIPLLVFVHGLGGSVAQFSSLLTSLTPIASCLAVDLPGCGRSDFAPRSWDAYSIDAMVELLETVIDEHRENDKQTVVLIGHSMGASLCALLIHPRSPPRTELSQHIAGLVAICPKADAPTEKETKKFKLLLSIIPEFLFDAWRAWDQRGGPESASVRRFVGRDDEPELKRLQNIFNKQSRSPVWRRMAWGSLSTYRDGIPKGGMPGDETWSGINVPTFLVAGADDGVCPPVNVEKIVGYLQDKAPGPESDVDEGAPITDAAAPVDSGFASSPDQPPSEVLSRDEEFNGLADSIYIKPSTPNNAPPPIPDLLLNPPKVVRTKELPSPAGHAMLYSPTRAPILAGLIATFLKDHVTGRLDLGWQLQYLSRDGKWDVKNLAKWKSVEPVSAPIGGVFRAIKTLREVDEVHCPKVFVHTWGKTITDVIDISHDNPVYDPKNLEAGGIKYHKCPTLSKVPPSDADIARFIDLVDKIRATPDEQQRPKEETLIGVHCHYGFNRTGYLIVCYLVERCGFSAKQAIEHFAASRPHGIKHVQHERTPLLAGSSPRTSEQSDRAAEEQDAAIYNTAVPPRADARSRTREIALFTWALLATAAVIVLAVVVQHQNGTGSPHVPPPDSASSRSHSHKPAKKNLIFMVSDGMGPASLSLTRSFRQVLEGRDMSDTLVLDQHFWGSSRTLSSNSFVTDSAAGATAFSCGLKSYNTAISMTPDYEPCGTQDEIAMQEVGEGVLGRTVDLMLGGGRCHFLPNTTAGSCRLDDVDVTEIAQKKHGYTYADDRAGFDALKLGKNVSLPLLGLFAAGDIPFEIDRRNMADVYPSLSEMALTALTALEEATKDSDKGFFLMIEGSRIDHAGHINDPAAQVREVLEYDKAFKSVIDFIEASDTEGVLVATSDHETGGLALALQTQGELPVYNWHPSVLVRANASSEYLTHLLVAHVAANPAEPWDELHAWINDELVVKRLGIRDALEVEINAIASSPALAVQAFARMVSLRARLGWSTHGHSAVDVNVYSSGGPGTERIRGNVENTEVGRFLREYLDVDVEAITRELRKKMSGRERPVGVEAVVGGDGGHPREWMVGEGEVVV
ncbi:alkaline phosphatase [Podospora conica]|nr:alkaline phosphatase [Schizothecium conicum]